MGNTNKLNYFFLFIYVSCLFSSIQIDSHITSKLNTTDIKVVDDSILISSFGGLYSIVDYNIIDIHLIEGLNINDISSPDHNQNLWTASRNKGIIQIIDSESFSVIDRITYPNFDYISNILHSSTHNKTYAVGCNGDCMQNSVITSSDYFLIQYDGYYYNNVIENFSIDFNVINDISEYNSYLYLATNNGILKSSLSNNQSLLLSSSWENEYFGENCLAVNKNILLTDNHILNIDDNNMISYEDLNINGQIIDLYDFNISDSLTILTNSNIYNISRVDLGVIKMINDIPISYNLTSIAKENDNLIIGLKNAGVLIYDLSTFEFEHIIPNTIFKNRYDSITVNENMIAGISKSGGFIMDNDDPNNIINFYPYAFSDTCLYSYNFPLTTNYYNAIYLPYWSGGKQQPSIAFSNDNLIFTNSGAYPFIDDNIAYHYQPIMNEFIENDILPEISYYGSLALLDLNNFNLTMKSNGVIGGLGGLLNSQETSGYMTVSQIKIDKSNNVWIVNPFCENHFINNERINRPIVYKKFNEISWNYIYDTESLEHFIPTEIAFSKNNRIWIAYKFYETDLGIYSKGGIRLIEYNDINDYTDDMWYVVNSTIYEDASIWSIEVGKDEYGNELLWILSDFGVQGYYFNIIETYSNDKIIDIIPINDDFYFRNTSFREGSKLRIDKNNNVWVLTNDEGLKMINNNGTVIENEINSYSSYILSDNISDISFDDKGKVYVATDQGISILNTTFGSSYNPKTISVSPNPFKVNQHNNIIFSNISPGSEIRIMTLTGDVIKTFTANLNGGVIEWDGKSDRGRKIATGVYILTATNIKENNGVTKIGIINE